MRIIHKTTGMLRVSTILGLMIGVLIYFTVSSVASEPIYGYTTAEEQAFCIDLVDKPQDDGTVILRYYPDVRVELLSDIEDGWAHVRVCNIDGYMKAKQVNLDPELTKSAHRLPVWILTGKNYDSGTVNFRELPTLEIPPLSYYYVQDKKEVHLMGISEEWYHVNIDGRMGFFKTDYLMDGGKVTEYAIGRFNLL